jgi:hypothetical protein
MTSALNIHTDTAIIGFVLLILAGRDLYRFFRGLCWPISQLYKSFDSKIKTPANEPPYLKRKIRLVLQNNSGSAVKAESPRWEAGPGDLAIQPIEDNMGAASGMRLEDKNAGGWKCGKWQSESNSQIEIPSDYAFEVWVGLNHAYMDEDLKLHEHQNNIGTLVIPVSIFGRKRPIKIRIK